MESTKKNLPRGINRSNSRNTPVKSVPPRVKNQYIRANCGSAPVRKIHDCLGQSFSRGDTWHSTLQKKPEMREEPPIYSERSSILSISTMTTMNYGKRLNMMTTCDPIHGIRFIVREFKQRLKAIYPEDEIFYQMISEIGHLVKRVEYGDVQEENKPKRYVEKVVVEKCCDCEDMTSVVRQLEEDLACEKEQNKQLSTRIAELESQIEANKTNVAHLEEELRHESEKVKKLQETITDKKLYDEALLNKFDNYNKKLQEVTQELFLIKIENERLLTLVDMKTQLIQQLQKDLDQIHEINKEILESTVTHKNDLESGFDLAKKSSTDLSYKTDESFMRLFVIGKKKHDQEVSFTSVRDINVKDMCKDNKE